MEAERKQKSEGGGLGKKFALKVFGVSGGGGNALDYMARQEITGVSFTAINTDAQALANLGEMDRFTLGATLRRGPGTGGDPELVRAAGEAAAEKLGALCAGADVGC